VLLHPGDPLWVDAWVPRDDPLWVNDVTSSAAWAGEWWCDALASLGVGDLTVHRGAAEPGEYGALVCFAGRGPGEVFSDARKVVGLSQWRGREGALFMMCAYTRWDPVPLVEVLDLPDPARETLAAGLAAVAVGVAQLVDGVSDLQGLADTLLSTFSGWAGPGGSVSP